MNITVPGYTAEDIARAKLIVEWCRKDLLSYTKFMKEDYDVQPFHDVIADALMKVHSWEIKRLAIEMPPRSGKSKLACINFPTWVLWHNPYAKIVVAWYGQQLPAEFSIEARNMLDSDKYGAIFDTKLETEKVDHRRTYDPADEMRDPDKAWYYHATGIGWWLTGYGWDILIVDDPVKNRDEAESVVYRDKVRNRYTSTLSTRFSNDQSAIIVIMTRWHIDDLRGRIEKLSDQFRKAWIDPEPRTLISIPALTRNPEVSPMHPVESEKRISFRPNKFGANYLLQKKVEIGIRDFSALYQQDPISSTWVIFKPADFRYVKLSDFEILNQKRQQLYRKEHIELRWFVDPAFSTDKDSDDASVAIMGKHKITKEVFLFDLYSGTSAPSVTIDILFGLMSKRKNRWFDNIGGISIEYVTLNKNQTDFFDLVEEEMSKRWDRYKLMKRHPKWAKDDRIKFSLEPIFTSHRLFFLDDQIPFEQMTKLTEQLQQFPNSNKKDVIDVVSQWVIVFRDGWIAEDPNKPKPQPKQKFNPLTGQKMQVWWVAKKRVF